MHGATSQVWNENTHLKYPSSLRRNKTLNQHPLQLPWHFQPPRERACKTRGAAAQVFARLPQGFGPHKVDHGIDEVVQFVHPASPVPALGAERGGAVEKASPPEPAARARGEPGGPRASGLTLAASVAHPALACLTLADHPQCVRRRALLGCFF